MTDASILLVHPGASALSEAMEAAVPGLRVTPCDTLFAARAHLVGTPFDAVLADARLSDGEGWSLCAMDVEVPPLLVRTNRTDDRTEAEQAGAALAFVSLPDPRVLAAVVAWHLAIPLAPPPTEAPEPPSADGHVSLQEVANELARLTHAVNNPLAVVVGNAELAKELLRAAPDDEMLPGSLSDIETAAKDLVALVDEIHVLRRRVDAALGE
ncbi:MAG: histidine kinase dimerization/phospho-acceptor domain-containing protein [Bacteroidota bacterium]